VLTKLVGRVKRFEAGGTTMFAGIATPVFGSIYAIVP